MPHTAAAYADLIEEYAGYVMVQGRLEGKVHTE
jgi:hypothetical protein